METIRDHGGVLFVDLRDHYGIMQVVFNDDSMLRGVNKETVIQIKGLVRERDEETINEKIETGTIEVKVMKSQFWDLVSSPCLSRLQTPQQQGGGQT